MASEYFWVYSIQSCLPNLLTCDHAHSEHGQKLSHDQNVYKHCDLYPSVFVDYLVASHGKPGSICKHEFVDINHFVVRCHRCQ